ncbi:MAG: hypothetical protein IRY90_03195, partial [Actinomadura rubrobrunea]|nr:hypothetical protein [Actinomadura rubrobrunea]
MTALDTAPAPVSRRRRAAFHLLRVSEVERLCRDAVAISFEVPADLAEDYAFRPGQFLTCVLYTTPSPRDGATAR